MSKIIQFCLVFAIILSERFDADGVPEKDCLLTSHHFETLMYLILFLGPKQCCIILKLFFPVKNVFTLPRITNQYSVWSHELGGAIDAVSDKQRFPNNVWEPCGIKDIGQRTFGQL